MLLYFIVALAFPQHAWATPKTVLIIRHAEKPKSGNHLSPIGREHARVLVNYFGSSPEVPIPDVIIAMAPGSEDESMRPIETVTPLAEKLNLKIRAKYSRNEIKHLVKKVLNSKKYDGKTVLICWEHKIIPKMIHHFGVDPKPKKWPGTDFSSVYRLDFKKDATVKSFRHFTQNISFASRDCIIKNLRGAR